jgi:diketogulonate reductase-like aldo/keto reductase
MSDISTIKLNTGDSMPAIGFGTWQIEDQDKAAKSVKTAIEVGYRLIDTAKIYGNEQGVGRGIAESGVARKEFFITTKLWNSDQGYESALIAFEQSLKRLGMEYLDLYLIHWPATDKRAESWKALQKIYSEGLANNIGVSNYTVRHLQELLAETDVVPAVNQIEFHPFIYEQQKEVLEFCREKGIVVEAYSPLARAKDLNNTTLHAIAERHGKTIAQVMLRWAIQHGTVPIPKSTNASRIKENFSVFDFKLSEEEMRTINKLSSGNRDQFALSKTLLQL